MSEKVELWFWVRVGGCHRPFKYNNTNKLSFAVTSTYPEKSAFMLIAPHNICIIIEHKHQKFNY